MAESADSLSRGLLSTQKKKLTAADIEAEEAFLKQEKERLI